MKTPLLFLLLPLFLLALTARWSPVIAQDEPEAVLDTMGRQLCSTATYFILPAISGMGGGLNFESTKNGTCPFDVVQDEDEESNGLPLAFSPVNPKEEIIRVLTDQNIRFAIDTLLPQPTVWNLGDFNESARTFLVETCGSIGNPGIETLSNWFRIEPFDDDYKLVFCPTVCNFCRPVCGDLGIAIQDGVRHLALGSGLEPLKIKFKKG
ncbi:PREDICTED: miraculin-like [Nelumbo nucifera]|uniref:Miraculin-like n=1 Tax=Nelumbo nucifera TaxID=4432 RepID=A0A1U8BQD2_NELNU|nr:PREDICTED: miraculin-like [Nelumbo nucifera]